MEQDLGSRKCSQEPCGCAVNQEPPSNGEVHQSMGKRDVKPRPLRGASQERVLMVVGHQSPDRTPRDFWAEPPALQRLYEHLGYRDQDRLLDDLGIDVVHLEAPAAPEGPIGGGVHQNFWGERYIYQATAWGPMREDVPGALAGAATFSELEAFEWPHPDAIDRSRLKQQCRRHNHRALLYGFADVWQRPALVRGWEGMFIDMAERPDWVHFLCRKFTDFYLEDYTRAAEITNGQIDLYLLISDLASQRGPLISPAMFDRFVSPYLKEMVDHIHGLGGLVVYHSCGAMSTFIPRLIKLGIDVLDPIQPAGADMQPEVLRARHGGQIAFHGGIDMQNLLPHGSPGQVKKEVQRYCQVLGEKGGYILSPAHLFQPDVPPQNILAVYRD